MANNPTLLKMPLARDGQKSTIPETTDGTTGLFSEQYGWQSINSLPLQAGGKAVKREDFNGAFNLLGGVAFYAQKGWTFIYDTTQAYYAGCTVADILDGKRYTCIADVSAGQGNPSEDTTLSHWLLSEVAESPYYYRQPGTAYVSGDIAHDPSFPSWVFLECKVGGTTDTGVMTVPATVEENVEVSDGTVTWTIRKIGSGGGEAIGVIKAFAGNGNIPSGYLLCDGSAVSRTMYPDLFSAIGTTYGAGDGSTTFNLPDYNQAERFAQGSTVAGTIKSAGLPNITGSYSPIAYANGAIGADTYSGAIEPYSPNHQVLNLSASGTRYDNCAVKLDASKSNPIYGNSTTVQPPALTARYIIKAFDGQTADSALIDITQYANELAGKADRSLSNLTDAGKQAFFPGSSGVGITLTTIGQTYVAPANGYIVMGVVPNNDGFISIETTSYVSASSICKAGLGTNIFTPIAKGDTATFRWTAGIGFASYYCSFIYDVLEVPAP